MGEAKSRAIEIAALKAQPTLHSINVFYKCNEPSGFSLTINNDADGCYAELVHAYKHFKQMSGEDQEKALGLFPKILNGVHVFVKSHPAGDPVPPGDQQILSLGARAVYFMEQEGLLPNDRWNGFEYQTMAEVDVFRQVLESINHKPGVFVLGYQHDDGCPKLHGGECSCIADVKLTAV
jgi:hypothetical protein